jgi:hypothetical protein
MAILPGISDGLILLLAIAIVWEAVWKGIALWKSGRNNQIAWFVCILIFNTLGILPIVYLALFQKRKVVVQKAPQKKTKRR